MVLGKIIAKKSTMFFGICFEDSEFGCQVTGKPGLASPHDLVSPSWACDHQSFGGVTDVVTKGRRHTLRRSSPDSAVDRGWAVHVQFGICVSGSSLAASHAQHDMTMESLMAFVRQFQQILLNSHRWGAAFLTLLGTPAVTKVFAGAMCESNWSSEEGFSKSLGVWGRTLPETNSKFAPENGWLEYDRFLLGFCLFLGANC